MQQHHACTCIVLYWVYLYRATLYKISMRFTSIFHGCRTCSFQYQLNSLTSIQPCCHHGAGKYSNTQAITVQPGTHSLLGRASAHAGEVSGPRTQRHTAAAETCTQDRSVRRRRPQSLHHDALHVYKVLIYFRCRDTEGGHCQAACHPQWFFYIPINVSETTLPFRWSSEPREIHSL